MRTTTHVHELLKVQSAIWTWTFPTSFSCTVEISYEAKKKVQLCLRLCLLMFSHKLHFEKENTQRCLFYLTNECKMLLCSSAVYSVFLQNIVLTMYRFSMFCKVKKHYKWHTVIKWLRLLLCLQITTRWFSQISTSNKKNYNKNCLSGALYYASQLCLTYIAK